MTDVTEFTHAAVVRRVAIAEIDACNARARAIITVSVDFHHTPGHLCKRDDTTIASLNEQTNRSRPVYVTRRAINDRATDNKQLASRVGRASVGAEAVSLHRQEISICNYCSRCGFLAEG